MKKLALITISLLLIASSVFVGRRSGYSSGYSDGAKAATATAIRWYNTNIFAPVLQARTGTR